jgi:hypothetical protein
MIDSISVIHEARYRPGISTHFSFAPGTALAWGAGTAAVPPPQARAYGEPVAVSWRFSRSVRRISARRAVAETCLRPAACAGTLASAPAGREIRGNREPLRLREVERVPG